MEQRVWSTTAISTSPTDLPSHPHIPVSVLLSLTAAKHSSCPPVFTVVHRMRTVVIMSTVDLHVSHICYVHKMGCFCIINSQSSKVFLFESKRSNLLRNTENKKLALQKCTVQAVQYSVYTEYWTAGTVFVHSYYHQLSLVTPTDMVHFISCSVYQRSLQIDPLIYWISLTERSWEGNIGGSTYCTYVHTIWFVRAEHSGAKALLDF